MATKLRLGELFAGYGGLGLAIEEVFDAELAWVSEFEEGPSKILAHHWPDVTNYGDITKINWADMPPVDILSGGFPCQDLSLAGRRRGMRDGTRSGLWANFFEGISVLRPMWVAAENVRGILSGEAHSDVEPCPWCVGDTGNEPCLRALGAVLADLASIGYDAQWIGLRAADVGAPHGRFRVFILAHDTERRNGPAENSDITAGSEWREPTPGHPESWRARTDPGGRSGTLAADADDAGRVEQRRTVTVQAEHSPAEHARTDAADAGSSTVGEHAGEPSAEETGAGSGDGSGDHRGERANGDGWTLTADSIGVGWDGRPRAQGRKPGERASIERPSETDTPAINWGEYKPAIRRWEHALGRRAPAPTEPTGRNGGHRLSARFAEWMMGLPDGWITDVPGITRNEALKAAGNGVCPQQAIAGFNYLRYVAQLPPTI